MMDFRFSEDEHAVAEAAAKVAADADPWNALTEGGWLDLLADDPESGLAYLGLVAEALGKAAVAVPLPGTAAVWPTLFGCAPGTRRVGVVEDGLGEDCATVDVVIVLEDNWAAAYDSFSVEPVGGLDGDGLARVAILGDPVAEIADAARLAQARHRAAALAAAEMAGAVRGVVDTTVAYVAERQQFGRTLSSFQVVQHGAARLAALGEAATWIARLACQDPMPEHVHAAKGWLSASAGDVAALAHQLHGAIGFTEEYGLGRLTKRLRILRFAWGGDPDHHLALGRLAAASA